RARQPAGDGIVERYRAPQRAGHDGVDHGIHETEEEYGSDRSRIPTANDDSSVYGGRAHAEQERECRRSKGPRGQQIDEEPSEEGPYESALEADDDRPDHRH